jgi:DNA-binding MarR family transcriptional regulator
VENLSKLMKEDVINNYPRLPIAKFNKQVNLSLKRLFESAGCDITREQEVILRELIQSDGFNQAELARRVGQDRNNLSRTLHLLEDRGLIKRVVRGEDKRNSNVRITAAGRKLHAQAFKAIEAYWNILFEGSSQADIAEISSNLERLSRNLSNFVENGENSQ